MLFYAQNIYDLSILNQTVQYIYFEVLQPTTTLGYKH